MLRIMRKERTINIIILAVCIILYIFIRIFRTIYSGNAFAFLRYHFTDLLAPIVILSYSGLLLNIVNHHSINKFLQIIALCVFCSFVWEYCAQFLYSSSTPDWLDVCSIFGGGFIYWIIINLSAKENKNGKNDS